jgi:hypothetical protein
MDQMNGGEARNPIGRLMMALAVSCGCQQRRCRWFGRSMVVGGQLGTGIEVDHVPGRDPAGGDGALRQGSQFRTAPYDDSHFSYVLEQWKARVNQDHERVDSLLLFDHRGRMN